MRFSDLFIRNRLREWREGEFYDAALVLRQLSVDLIERAEFAIDELPTRALFLQQGTFLSSVVQPMVREAAEPVLLHLTETANRKLSELASFSAVWGESPTDSAAESGADGWQDFALAAVPIAGSVATAAAIPAAGITTTTAMFGLMTTTTISWPVVVTGGVVATGLLATGVWNTAQLADRLRQRLKKKAREQIWMMLIAGKKSKSLLEQYAAILEETASRARLAR